MSIWSIPPLRRASVCIQRSWRRYKGLEWRPPEPMEVEADSQQAAAATEPAPRAAVAVALKPASPPLPPVGAPPSVTDGSTVTRIDYDTYLANRRPGSKTPSIVSSAGRKAANTEDVRVTGYSEDKVGVRPQLFLERERGAKNQQKIPPRSNINLIASFYLH